MRCMSRHFARGFQVTDDTSHIKADVREDGGFDRNTGLSAIKQSSEQSTQN